MIDLAGASESANPKPFVMCLSEATPAAAECHTTAKTVASGESNSTCSTNRRSREAAVLAQAGAAGRGKRPARERRGKESPVRSRSRLSPATASVPAETLSTHGGTSFGVADHPAATVRLHRFDELGQGAGRAQLARATLAARSRRSPILMSRSEDQSGRLSRALRTARVPIHGSRVRAHDRFIFSSPSKRSAWSVTSAARTLRGGSRRRSAIRATRRACSVMSPEIPRVLCSRATPLPAIPSAGNAWASRRGDPRSVAN